MNLHLIAAAEKVRIGRELVGDAKDLMRSGSVVNRPELGQQAQSLAIALQMLWVDLARLAGVEYQAAINQAHAEATARKLAEIFALALQIPRDEIEALLTNPRFLFKSTARAVLAIQDELTVQSIALEANAERGARNAEAGGAER